MDETNSLGPSSTRVDEVSSKQHQFAPKRSGLETLISAQVAVADVLVAESAKEQDQVWRLPLWEGYRKEIDSKVADLKNIGNGPYGGAITAALYLNEFVEPAPPAAEPSSCPSAPVSMSKGRHDSQLVT